MFQEITSRAFLALVFGVVLAVIGSEKNLTRIERQTATLGVCVVPKPLLHGKYRPSVNRCPPGDISPACLMTPGAFVPYDWVIFFECDDGYVLNSTQPVTFCKNGLWKPELPICKRAVCPTLVAFGVDMKCTYAKQTVPCDELVRLGTVATLTCKDGYHLPPHHRYTQLTCMDFGAWDYPPLYCIPDVIFESTDCRTPRDMHGKCIDIKSCPVLLDMLKQQTEPGWREYLRQSQCGTKEGNTVKVCCPSTPGEDDLPDTNICGKSEIFYSSSRHRVRRVVNGAPASLGAWPWMGAIGYQSPTKELEWLCAGSLISNRHVLTGAYCVTNLNSNKLVVVRLGDLNLQDSFPDRATPIDVPIEKFVVHEEYNDKARTTDIALITLRERVNFTDLIRPICIPTPSTFPQNMSGYSAFVIGWGKTTYGSREPPTTALQEAELDIVDQDFCANAFKNLRGTNTNINDRVICALSDEGKDTCQGDRGAPLMVPKMSNYYVVGITSFGYRCAEPGYPGVYTKVSRYVNWIKKMIRS